MIRRNIRRTNRIDMGPPPPGSRCTPYYVRLTGVTLSSARGWQTRQESVMLCRKDLRQEQGSRKYAAPLRFAGNRCILQGT